MTWEPLSDDSSPIISSDGDRRNSSSCCNLLPSSDADPMSSVERNHVLVLGQLQSGGRRVLLERQAAVRRIRQPNAAVAGTDRRIAAVRVVQHALVAAAGRREITAVAAASSASSDSKSRLSARLSSSLRSSESGQLQIVRTAGLLRAAAGRLDVAAFVLIRQTQVAGRAPPAFSLPITVLEDSEVALRLARRN